MQGEKVAQISHQLSNHESDPQATQKLPTKLLSAEKQALLPAKFLSYLEFKCSDCHLNRNRGKEREVQGTALN